MIVHFGRRSFEFFVAVFAVLGFIAVPLGERTGWEHLKSVLATPAAKDAQRELGQALTRLYQKVFVGEPEDIGSRAGPWPHQTESGLADQTARGDSETESSPEKAPKNAIRPVPPKLHKAALPDASVPY